MPLIQTRGAASAQGFGEFAQASAVNYIEDMFSCFLYTGNGSTQTITNNIDLSTKGGLVWAKSRAAGSHFLYDTTRGVNKYLMSNATDSQITQADSLTAFNTTGFSIGNSLFNDNAVNYVSWTFRKQPKFFDVVTYTGTGSNTTIAHSLGSVPGSIIIKRTDTTANWAVYHRSLANTQYLVLNSTAAAATGATWWNSTTPTSAVFSLGTDATVNASGATYVAYLFAHDAGGFGLTGTDNVISCGSATPDGSGIVNVTLGYEPQWLLVKTVAEGTWFLVDNMRGFSVTNAAFLRAQTSDAESSGAFFAPNSTGFTLNSLFGTSQPVIYIAIRRGPMKVPTLGTSVFSPIARAGTSATATVTTGFPVDMTIIQDRTQNSFAAPFDRLRGATNRLFTPFTLAEASEVTTLTSFAVQNGFTLGTDLSAGFVNATGDNYINWSFRRAPSFFDEVCYTGNGNTRTFTHNLGVTPELIIIKNRYAAADWGVFHTFTTTQCRWLRLNLNSANESITYSGSNVITGQPTATTFATGGYVDVNQDPPNTYVAYLFATCPGVSKVFSYTGNGSSQTINCGFTAGSRWVMIKRTNSTGDWYVWDSARGIVAGNDPHLSLNTTAAEVTTDDSVDTDNTGFVVNQVSATDVNVSSATYIGIAIA